MDDAHFLEGVNRKEPKAWERLYDYFYAPLCCYATRVVKDEERAKDIVQECMVQLWRSKVVFEDIKVLTAYVYRAVYRASLNDLRSRERSQRLHEEWTKELLRNEEEGMEKALEEETISRFYAILERLPEQQRDIILLCMKGLKVREIAVELDISENTVKTQKKRAYQFIRGELGELWAVVVSLLFI